MGKNSYGDHSQVTRKVPLSSWEDNKLYYKVTHVNSSTIYLDIEPSNACNAIANIQFFSCDFNYLNITCPNTAFKLHFDRCKIYHNISISPSSTILDFSAIDSSLSIDRVYPEMFTDMTCFDFNNSQIALVNKTPLNIHQINLNNSAIFNPNYHYCFGPRQYSEAKPIFTPNIPIFDSQINGGSMIDGIGELPPNDNFHNLPEMERDDQGFIVYKQFAPFYISPKHWIIEPDSIIRNIVDRNRLNLCSYGINVSPSVKSLLKVTGKMNIPIWKCRIRYQWIHETVFPYESPDVYGADKFRTGILELLEVVPFDNGPISPVTGGLTTYQYF